MKEKVEIPVWLFLIGFISIIFTTDNILNGIIDMVKFIVSK